MPSLQVVSCSSTLLHVSKLHLHLAFASQQQKNCGFLASRCPSGLLSRCSIGNCCVAVLCNTQIDTTSTKPQHESGQSQTATLSNSASVSQSKTFIGCSVVFNCKDAPAGAAHPTLSAPAHHREHNKELLTPCSFHSSTSACGWPSSTCSLAQPWRRTSMVG
jgi:hypothetical protein